MQTFLGLMRVLLLLALTFLTYWGLAVVLYQDFQFQLTLGNDPETGQQLFYIIPWLVIMVVILLPTLGTIAAMRKWILEKAWRKALAALVLLIQLGLIVLISQQRASLGEISFRPWPEEAALSTKIDAAAAPRIDSTSEETFQESVEKIKATLSGDERREFEDAIASLSLGLKDVAKDVLNGKTAQEVITEAKDWRQLAEELKYNELQEKHIALLKKLKRFYDAYNQLDDELDKLEQVESELVEAGKADIDTLREIYDYWNELMEYRKQAVIPRSHYLQKQGDVLTAMQSSQHTESQKEWMKRYATEADEAVVWIDGHTSRIEEELAKVRRLMSD